MENVEVFTTNQETMKRDLQELEGFIYPNYQKAASNIIAQKNNAKKHTQKMITALTKQGEALHKEIDTTIEKLQSEINEMDAQCLVAIENQTDAINNTITEIKQSITDIKKMLDSDDFDSVSVYQSRNEEFRNLPLSLNITLPTFTFPDINRELINKQIGYLSKLAITTENHDCLAKTPGAMSSRQPRSLIEDPLAITFIKTGCRTFSKRLLSVACLNDDEIWTRGTDNIMRLYNLHGKLLKSVETKSGNAPVEIAVPVKRSGDLMYSDNMSINIVKTKHIHMLIKLRRWRPRGICSTTCEDLLVIMDNDDGNQTKVVRYSGSIEKQSIQWDEQGRALYSSSGLINDKYLSENRNLDICVADCNARAVVVVSAAGKLRFRYTGHPSSTKGSFDPLGITTDSLGKILIADRDNRRIHILDQDGHFLRYIDNCHLKSPWGLCVDSKDNLLVAEVDTGLVKKIQYYK